MIEKGIKFLSIKTVNTSALQKMRETQGKRVNFNSVSVTRVTESELTDD